MDNADILKMVVKTLNKIKVSGEEDLDRMLGSIRAIREVAARIASETGATEKESEDGE